MAEIARRLRKGIGGQHGCHLGAGPDHDADRLERDLHLQRFGDRADGWLGHAALATTNRYAEINTKTKLAALQAAEPHNVPAGSRTNPIWRSDQSLLNWLASL